LGEKKLTGTELNKFKGFKSSYSFQIVSNKRILGNTWYTSVKVLTAEGQSMHYRTVSIMLYNIVITAKSITKTNRLLTVMMITIDRTTKMV